MDTGDATQTLVRDICYVYETRLRRCSVLWTIDNHTFNMWLASDTPQKIVEG